MHLVSPAGPGQVLGAPEGLGHGLQLGDGLAGADAPGDVLGHPGEGDGQRGGLFKMRLNMALEPSNVHRMQSIL